MPTKKLTDSQAKLIQLAHRALEAGLKPPASLAEQKPWLEVFGSKSFITVYSQAIRVAQQFLVSGFLTPTQLREYSWQQLIDMSSKTNRAVRVNPPTASDITTYLANKGVLLETLDMMKDMPSNQRREFMLGMMNTAGLQEWRLPVRRYLTFDPHDHICLTNFVRNNTHWNGTTFDATKSTTAANMLLRAIEAATGVKREEW
jgi:hypothetical protein